MNAIDVTWNVSSPRRSLWNWSVTDYTGAAVKGNRERLAQMTPRRRVVLSCGGLGERSMEAGGQPVPELIFTLRLLIARAGEKDGLAWWDSEAMSDAGQFVLKRLFPRSHRWAGAELALEAATIRHRRLLGDKTDVLSLFSLGDAIEHAVDVQLQHLRRSGSEPPSLRAVSSIEALAELLRQRGQLTVDEVRAPEEQRMLGLQAVEIGQLTRRQAAGQGEVAQAAKRLAAAYTLGEPGNLVVPYLRLTGKDSG